MAELKPPFMFWLHVGSLGRVWDAPLEFRNQYSDEDDPPLPESPLVPNEILAADFDPDLLLGFTHSYAGQVTLLDLCLGSLLESLAATSLGRNMLTTVLSARGFPLGEHGRVGACDDALYGELTQIPWLLRFPDGSGAAERTQALVQPADLSGDFGRLVRAPGDCGRHAGDCRGSLAAAVGGDDDGWRPQIERSRLPAISAPSQPSIGINGSCAPGAVRKTARRAPARLWRKPRSARDMRAIRQARRSLRGE